MREKIYNILNKIYGVTILVSLFAGFLPIFPFIIAIFVGGEVGASISVFLYKQYYIWVAVLASVSVVVGIVAMYVGKCITFKFPKKTSVKDANVKESENKTISENKNEQN